MPSPDYRVLVVDDEEDIRTSMATLLPLLIDGTIVDTAEDGVEGLARLAERDYDLIISDQRMPHMAGTEFLAEARRRCPQVPRLLYTAYGHELDDRRDDLLSLVEAVIPKSMDLDRVQSIVQAALMKNPAGT